MFSWPISAALCLSFCAALASAWSLFRMRSRHRHRTLEKRLNDMECDLAEMRDKVSALDSAARRAYGRLSQQKRRDSSTQGGDGLPDPQTDPEGWKREMMKRHKLGGLNNA